MMFWIVLLLFSLTYLGLAVGKVPGLRIDRAGIALVGATAMLATSAVPFEDAFSPRCINFEAIVLLFGMMILVGLLRLSGFFECLILQVLPRVRSPRMLLSLTIALSGVLSAFLVNDIICIALTPLVIALTRKLRYDPVPHLLGLATASNIGSSGAITGNPQNIIIGMQSKISYFRFSAKLFPLAMLGLVVAYLLIAWIHRRRLLPPPAEPPDFTPSDLPPPSPPHGWPQLKAAFITLSTVVLFFALPSAYLAVVALVAASAVLLGRVNPDKIYRQVDWPLLVLFCGLFVVVYAFRVHVVSLWNVAGWTWLLDRPIDVLSLVSAALSNLVSNVPAVLLFEPVLEAVPAEGREGAWLALAMSSTLAGNLTVLGSVANLIVVEMAKHEGVEISFVEYCKVGVPLTVLTLAMGVAWLMFVRY